MKNFFQMDGPVMRAMSDLSTLVILNLVTMLCCLPVVTAGASLSAMHYILMQMPDEQVGHVIPAFFRQFRGNLRCSTLPWLILLAVGALFYMDYRVFGSGDMNRALVIPAYAGMGVVLLLYVWMFPLLARFDNTTAATLRNTMILAAGNLPRTLAMAALSAVVPFVLTQSLRLLPLAFLVGFTLPGYFCMLIYRSVIEGLVEKAKGKKTDGVQNEEEKEI
ncbi:MAG: YesL family protein [Lachnospiraceae bacterium]|nr:YesL family protein [Lachnospiraceae bacterium]